MGECKRGFNFCARSYPLTFKAKEQTCNRVTGCLNHCNSPLFGEMGLYRLWNSRVTIHAFYATGKAPAAGTNFVTYHITHDRQKGTICLVNIKKQPVIRREPERQRWTRRRSLLRSWRPVRQAISEIHYGLTCLKNRRKRIKLCGRAGKIGTNIKPNDSPYRLLETLVNINHYVIQGTVFSHSSSLMLWCIAGRPILGMVFFFMGNASYYGLQWSSRRRWPSWWAK